MVDNQLALSRRCGLMQQVLLRTGPVSCLQAQQCAHPKQS